MFSDSRCVSHYKSFPHKEISMNIRHCHFSSCSTFKDSGQILLRYFTCRPNILEFWNILATIGDCFSNTKVPCDCIYALRPTFNSENVVYFSFFPN